MPLLAGRTMGSSRQMEMDRWSVLVLIHEQLASAAIFQCPEPTELEEYSCLVLVRDSPCIETRSPPQPWTAETRESKAVSSLR